MSIGKCSIGVIRRCFFFKPRPLNFPGRRRLEFSSISIGESCFFAEVGKCFPFRAKENMPVSAETQLRLSSNEKTQPTYIVNFYGNTDQKSILNCKKISSASICKKKLCNAGRKISVVALQRPMSAIVFSIQSLNSILDDDVYWEMFDRRHPAMLLF